MAKRESIQYTMSSLALKDIQNNNTVRAYKTEIKRFAAWARTAGFKTVEQIRQAGTNTVIQRYRDEAVLARTKSAQTEHRAIAAVCKGLGVVRPRGKGDPGWEGRIITTKRTADGITRGRQPGGNQRGRAEEQDSRYSRLVSLQQAVGIRRSELAHLKGRDLVTDETGYLCVQVERGKGGKYQLQRILPGDVPVVKAVFADAALDQRVFTGAEMKNHINLHRMRALHAQEAYSHYVSKMQAPGGREALAAELRARFNAMQPGGYGKAAFYAEIAKGLSDPAYHLRGANREKALALGLPTEYDRLALMAVSVFHLSHWRIGVTVTNYMIQ